MKRKFKQSIILLILTKQATTSCLKPLKTKKTIRCGVRNLGSGFGQICVYIVISELYMYVISHIFCILHLPVFIILSYYKWFFHYFYLFRICNIKTWIIFPFYSQCSTSHFCNRTRQIHRGNTKYANRNEKNWWFLFVSI